MYDQTTTARERMNPMNDTPHARAFDLPGWPCPPRVRDIPNRIGNWGYVPCHSASQGVYQDELGRLWADGNMVPTFRTLNGNGNDSGAIVAWTEQGLGVYVHPQSLRHIGSISKLDMEPDRWVPIAVVLAEVPKECRS